MSIRLNDSQARDILASLGTGLSRNALDLVQAVARMETGYGGKWQLSSPPCDQGDGSNNWGAMKTGKSASGGPGAWSCPAGAFPCFDEDKTRPHCFATYLSPEAGASALVGLLLRMKHVRPFLLSGGGSAAEMAHAMRLDGYYTLGESQYARALAKNLTELRASIGESSGAVVAATVVGVSLLGVAFAGWRFSR